MPSCDFAVGVSSSFSADSVRDVCDCAQELFKVTVGVEDAAEISMDQTFPLDGTLVEDSTADSDFPAPLKMHWITVSGQDGKMMKAAREYLLACLDTSASDHITHTLQGSTDLISLLTSSTNFWQKQMEKTYCICVSVTPPDTVKVSGNKEARVIQALSDLMEVEDRLKCPKERAKDVYKVDCEASLRRGFISRLMESSPDADWNRFNREYPLHLIQKLSDFLLVPLYTDQSQTPSKADDSVTVIEDGEITPSPSNCRQVAKPRPSTMSQGEKPTVDHTLKFGQVTSLHDIQVVAAKSPTHKAAKKGATASDEDSLLAPISTHQASTSTSPAFTAQEFMPGPSSIAGQQRPSSPQVTVENPGDLENVGGPEKFLRPVIIDAPNVGFAHGKNKVMSAKGVAIAVQYFVKKGHKVTAFISEGFSPSRATNFHMLDRLYDLDLLVKCTARRIPMPDGSFRCVSNYDDLLIVDYARTHGGVIVSRDQFQDVQRNLKKTADSSSDHYLFTIAHRLLGPIFSGDEFMLAPDGPMARFGASLSETLSVGTDHKDVPLLAEHQLTKGEQRRLERELDLIIRNVVDDTGGLRKRTSSGRVQGVGGISHSATIPQLASSTSALGPHTCSDQSLFSSASSRLPEGGGRRGEDLPSLSNNFGPLTDMEENNMEFKRNVMERIRELGLDFTDDRVSQVLTENPTEFHPDSIVGLLLD